MYKIYLLPGDENDATDYYLNIIAKALDNKGEECSRVYKLKDIESQDKVLVIQPKAFLKVLFKNRKQHIFYWFQGITPEEALLIFHGKLEGRIRYLAYSFIERLVFKYAFFVLFVSQAMLKHYEKKYGYKKQNFFIIPCFNKKLNESAFFIENRYEKEAFVYAGSMSEWQCISQTLALFVKIKEDNPKASLTLLTKDERRAEELLVKFGLKDVVIKYIPYEELDAELQNYKFGFLLRENIEVNNVATPTKLNTYIANGIIPVYSNVILDFHENFRNLEYMISVDFNDFQSCIKLIREKKLVDSQKILLEYKSIFDSYYNEDFYLKQLCSILYKFNA